MDVPVLLSFESCGTRRLFHLLPQLKLALDKTGLAVLDQIDGYLHVDIVTEILGWFRSRDSNPRDARLYPKYRAGVLGGIPKIG